MSVSTDATGRRIAFALAVRPLHVMGPMFSRYETGHVYGTHVDDALLAGRRSDVSFTLFLSDPDSYEGGELVLDSSFGEEAVKLTGELDLGVQWYLGRLAGNSTSTTVANASGSQGALGGGGAGLGASDSLFYSFVSSNLQVALHALETNGRSRWW